MRHRLLKLLNVRPRESALVKQLFLVQFFLMLGASLLFVTANALFLPAYPIAELPRAYLISAVFLVAGNVLYGKIEHALEVQQQLRTMIAGMAVITLLVWATLEFTDQRWPVYVFFIWNNLVYLLSGLLFWGLAALLFDVRESRRIFIIIGAGDIPAKLLGYLAVSALAPFTGLKNMIWIAVASFVAAILFLQAFFRRPPVQALPLHDKHPEAAAVTMMGFLKKFFGSELIIRISLLSFITFSALLLIDFTFLTEVKVKYHTQMELAYFLGIFFAAGRILAILLKVTLSSRLINRIGMIRSLLLSPLILTVFILFILAGYRSDHFSGQFLYIIGLMALLTEILKAVIQEPVFLVLFQPLKPMLRLHGHLIAKGYMLPLAFFVTGGFLFLYLQKTSAFSVHVFGLALLLLLLVWTGSVFMVKKEYLKTLHDALKSGRFRGSELLLKDSSIREVLLKKIENGQPAGIIYALDLLEKSGYEKTDALLVSLLKHKERTVVRYALEKIAAKRYLPAIPEVEDLLRRGTESAIQAKCLQILGMLNPGLIEKFFPYLQSDDLACRDAAITGLIKSGDLHALLTAGQQLLQLIQSPDAAARIRAAGIIGATEDKNFHRTLRTLMEDPDTAVQRSALMAAGKLQSEALLPLLCEKLSQPGMRKEAVLAMLQYDNAVFGFFNTLLQKSDSLLPHFVAIAGKLNTEPAVLFLLRCLRQYPAARKSIVDYLWQKEYTSKAAERPFIHSLLKNTLVEIRETVALKETLTQISRVELLINALTLEINTGILHALKLLSFLYDRQKVNRAIRVIPLQDKTKTSNALEMLELIAPREVAAAFNLIIERNGQPAPPPKTWRTPQGLLSVIEPIISDKRRIFNDWTKAMAVAAAGALKDPHSLAYLADLPSKNLAPIIQETKAFVISG